LEEYARLILQGSRRHRVGASTLVVFENDTKQIHHVDNLTVIAAEITDIPDLNPELLALIANSGAGLSMRTLLDRSFAYKSR
jgi:hypothetical protein